MDRQVYVLYGTLWTATSCTPWIPVLFDDYGRAREYMVGEFRNYLKSCGYLGKDGDTVVPTREVDSITVNGVSVTDPIFGRFRVSELLDVQLDTLRAAEEFSGIEWRLRSLPVHAGSESPEGAPGRFRIDA